MSAALAHQTQPDARPLAIDLFCGLGGWTEGLLAEGYRVRGYDIEAHQYGDERYPAELVLKDVLTLDGAALADAALIVASPPCQEYSYMAMPWGRAKQFARALRGEDVFPDGHKGSRTIDELNALFLACFRIQREASAAAGRPIPMVVENVKGAQPWVGRARWSFGSYFLWGDVPALMPIQRYHARQKVKEGEQWNVNRANFTGTLGWDEGLKNPGFRFGGSDGSPSASFQTESVNRHVDGVKNPGRSLAPGSAKFNDRIANYPPEAARDMKPPARVADREPDDGRKSVGSGAKWFDQNIASLPSHSKRRKAASAKIAKIPLVLSTHIARVYRPKGVADG